MVHYCEGNMLAATWTGDPKCHKGSSMILTPEISWPCRYLQALIVVCYKQQWNSTRLLLFMDAEGQNLTIFKCVMTDLRISASNHLPLDDSAREDLHYHMCHGHKFWLLYILAQVAGHVTVELQYTILTLTCSSGHLIGLFDRLYTSGCTRSCKT